VITKRLILVLDRAQPTHGPLAHGSLPDAEGILTAQPGVQRVYLSATLETVYVVYDPEQCSPARLVTALARHGFRIDATRPG
jgi:hypothetical protein